MILIISDKDRVPLGKASISGIKFVAAEFDIVNVDGIVVSVIKDGTPFFFDFLSDRGDWIAGGRFRNSMSECPTGSTVLFNHSDLHLLSR